MSPLFSRRLIRLDHKTGRYQINLNDDEKAILRHLVPQIVELIADPQQAVVRRVFPPAYSDPAHVEQEEEYHRLMQDDLAERRKAELELLAETADAESLSEEQLMSWMRALNSIRLVLGTYIGVSEDDERRRPETPEDSVYQWLTYVQGEAIEALAGHT